METRRTHRNTVGQDRRARCAFLLAARGSIRFEESCVCLTHVQLAPRCLFEIQWMFGLDQGHPNETSNSLTVPDGRICTQHLDGVARITRAGRGTSVLASHSIAPVFITSWRRVSGGSGPRPSPESPSRQKAESHRGPSCYA